MFSQEIIQLYTPNPMMLAQIAIILFVLYLFYEKIIKMKKLVKNEKLSQELK